LATNTVGNKVFAAMKGAVDGGLNIPHKDKVFPKAKEEKGAQKGEKKNLLRDRIFGVHVTEYMEKIKKDTVRYKKQFSNWDKCLQAAKVTTVQDLIKKCHAEIRKNPDRPKKVKKEQKPTTYSDKERTIITSAKKPYKKDRKLTNKQRRERVNAKIAKYAQQRNKSSK